MHCDQGRSVVVVRAQWEGALVPFAEMHYSPTGGCIWAEHSGGVTLYSQEGFDLTKRAQVVGAQCDRTHQSGPVPWLDHGSEQGLRTGD